MTVPKDLISKERIAAIRKASSELIKTRNKEAALYAKIMQTIEESFDKED